MKWTWTVFNQEQFIMQCIEKRIELYFNALHFTVLHGIAMHCTVFRCTKLHYTELH